MVIMSLYSKVHGENDDVLVQAACKHARAPVAKLKLGLIGDNIAPSRAPYLHRLAGRMTGFNVQYDLLVPANLGLDFIGAFNRCAATGYRGINVTLPYKERVAAVVRIDDPLIHRLGAINTVLFAEAEPIGRNTDYSGFAAAYRATRGAAAPGTVCQIGAGGVGKAIAFALLGLGVASLRLVEQDLAKAAALAEALRLAAPHVEIAVTDDARAGADGAAGLINCTPVGMVGYGGTPLAAASMAGAEWAFDAVYTPRDTQFLADAAAAGLTVISGYELFFFQGVHAWELFSGRPVDTADLRRALAEEEAAGGAYLSSP